VALLIMVALPALADVNGQITTTKGRTLAGKIRWQPASKAYAVTDIKGIMLQVPEREIARVSVDKPVEIDGAVNLMGSGNYAKAIPILEKVRTDYTRLQWDVEAARRLAEAYLATGDPAKAVQMCESVIEMNPELARAGDLPPIHWNALHAAGRDATLKKMLDDAVESGTRQTAAMAQIMRGDVEKKNGNFREALVDGYLRTVVLFEDVKVVQPEALYKAAKCFEQLGQLAYVERMRRKLMEEYSRSAYADKMRSGS